MRKLYYSISTLLCLLFCAVLASAQERIMFSRVEYDEGPGGLYYINKDGTGETYACDFLPSTTLGSRPEYFIVSKDNEIVGINSAEGRPETDEGTGYGTLYRLTGKGVVKVQDFNYAEASNTFIIESLTDQKLYGVGPQPILDQILQGTKYTGLTGTEIYTYGFHPGELLAATNGNIYGNAQIGGANGQGYIYRFAGTKIAIVYSFAKATGHYPQGQLMQGLDGYIYGVTKRGGQYDYGVIYKVKTDGTGYQVLHHFNKTNGMNADRGLVQDGLGNLYGMTFSGGTNNLGVIYKIRPDGTGFTKLHDFALKQTYYSGVTQSLLMDSFGVLYGRVPQSQSLLFSIKPDGSNFKIIFNKEIYISTLRMVPSITPEYKLTNPANGATGVATTRTFVADSVPGAVTYTLELSLNASFSPVYRSIQRTEHKFPVANLSPNTKYYARVKTSLWSRPGPATTFTTSATTATSLVTTPANGAVNVAAPLLKVTVKAVTGAKRYTVQLNTASDFSGTMLTQTSTTDDQRTLTFTGLQYSTKYYARVKTDINETFGTVTSFTTKAETFSMLVTPSNGATNVDREILQTSVLPIAGAKEYTLQISTSSTFASNNKTIKGVDDNQTTFLLRDLKPLTRYYARVTTDISTRYGPVRSFTTKAAKSALRIVGTTTFAPASVFSFSVDSGKYMTHHVLEGKFASYTDLVRGPDGFYGTMHGTGDNNDYKTGAMYRYDFTTGFLQSAPMAISREIDMTMASNGQLYITQDYAPYGNGAIYKAPPTLAGNARIHSFRSETGMRSRAPLLDLGDGYLYGTTLVGGLYNGGVIFRMRGNGSKYEVIHHFVEFSSGYIPAGGLTDGGDGYLYGTVNGGQGNSGGVFRIKPDGSSFTPLHTFTGPDGRYPIGELLIENGVMYGMTNAGGLYDEQGTLYKMNLNGSGFVVLKHFNDRIAANPITGVVSDGKGMLYGMLPFGGYESNGSIFRIRTDGSNYQVLFEFTHPAGLSPFGKLILMEDPFTGAAPATAKADVNVYPNPTTSSFNITVDDNEDKNATFELTDFTGTVVHRGKLNKNTSSFGDDLPRGVYVLKVQRQSSITQHTLIKK